MYECRHFYDDDVQDELWWAPHVKDFRLLSTFRDPIRSLNNDMPANVPKIEHGAAFRTMCINVPQYLTYLMEKAQSLGVKIIKARLPIDSGLSTALEQAESTAMAHGRRQADAFVNATGLGAAKLCGDKAMYPIRGQTVLVKGEAETTISRFGNERAYEHGTYVIPRPGSGTTILGGTRQEGNWSEAVDQDVTKAILDRCSRIVPELLTGPEGGFEVVSVQCGLRPGRKGGHRMEKEAVAGKKVVHAYGHSGGGYQNSVGSARLVVELVNESIGSSGVSAKL